MNSEGVHSNYGAGLSIEHREGWVWITLPDAINMDNQQSVQCRIESILTPGCRIALDLSTTRNMYSSGFGMIVRLKRVVEEKGGALVLVNVPERTMEAFRGVGLDKLLRIFAHGEALDLSGV